MVRDNAFMVQGNPAKFEPRIQTYREQLQDYLNVLVPSNSVNTSSKALSPSNFGTSANHGKYDIAFLQSRSVTHIVGALWWILADCNRVRNSNEILKHLQRDRNILAMVRGLYEVETRSYWGVCYISSRSLLTIEITYFFISLPSYKRAFRWFGIWEYVITCHKFAQLCRELHLEVQISTCVKLGIISSFSNDSILETKPSHVNWGEPRYNLILNSYCTDIDASEQERDGRRVWWELGSTVDVYPKRHHVILLISANVPRGTWGNFELNFIFVLFPPSVLSIISADLLACSQKLRLATSNSVGTSLRRHLGGSRWRTQALGFALFLKTRTQRSNL